MSEQKQPTEEFKPPRHWVDIEELKPEYWADPKVQEKRDQEFLEKPIDSIALIDQLDTKGLQRRDFLTIMGASMALSSLGFARKPVHKIIPYVVKPAEITPGIPTWYASTFNDGLSSTGILIKNREGRPIKLEGNPDDPGTLGASGLRAQASLLDLYDPDRLKGPLAFNRREGSERKVTWSEANTEIQKILRSVASDKGRVRFLTGYQNSPSTKKLTKEFLSAFRSGAQVAFQPGVWDQLLEAQAVSYGKREIPQFRFDQADVIVSLGADFLQNWVSPTEHTKQWVQRRKLDRQASYTAKMSRMICFESTVTLTGSNADERFGVRPGDELRLALAIANEIVVQKGLSRFAGTSVVGTLKDYSSEKVASDIQSPGVTAEKIRELAEELWAARGKSLIIGGGIHSTTENALALQVAVNFLNEVLGNEGKTVGSSDVSQPGETADYEALVNDMDAGKVDLLVIHGTNPAFFDASFSKALKSVPTVITIAEKLDETARLSDFALASHHFLENWGDAQTRAGVKTLQQPALHPLHDTWSFEDILIKWIRSANLNAGGLAGKVAKSVTANTWHDYLKENWKSSGTSWEEALRKGVVGRLTAPRVRTFRSSTLALLPRFRSGASALTLALYQKAAIGDGSGANNAWLQELPDPVSTVTWDNYLNVAPATAKKMGFHQHDVVKVSAAGVSREIPVNIQPGMHENVVSVAVGYGRTAAGRVGTAVGVNVYPFSKWKNGRVVYSGHEVTSIVRTGRRYELALTQGHHRTKGRPIMNDITLDQYRKNPAEENHTSPHLRLDTVPSAWPKHEYKSHRWGMAIDLTACTGCGSCIVACQAENNIPVVGRDRVRVGREMHWIRIDRYYSGPENSPDVVFQPMLCQHCENASCETVCPVLATVHSDEGLNDMVYNRCVGTRYCQNNCPYKVRRFNFFDHWKDYQKPMNLVWNPDVTVRSRGVMEKCTFCVQRIQSARDESKKKGQKRIPDGSIQTACQQACPSEAIQFGDINDPNSQVSVKQAEARAFRALEDINNKPSISYLTKVRNKKKGHSHVSHDH